jgi:hypothetical protein
VCVCMYVCVYVCMDVDLGDGGWGQSILPLSPSSMRFPRRRQLPASRAPLRMQISKISGGRTDARPSPAFIILIPCFIHGDASRGAPPANNIPHAATMSQQQQQQQQARQYKAIGEDLWKNRTEKVVSRAPLGADVLYAPDVSLTHARTPVGRLFGSRMQSSSRLRMERSWCS